MLLIAMVLMSCQAGARDEGTGTVHLEVRLDDGEPAQGIMLQLTMPEERAGHFTITDANGTATLVAPAGEYLIAMLYEGTPIPETLISLEPSDAFTSEGNLVIRTGGSISITATLAGDIFEDTDGDGWPDWWELENGRDPDVPEPGGGFLGESDPEGLPAVNETDGEDNRFGETLLIIAGVGGIIAVIASLGYSKVRRERLLDQTTRQSIYKYIEGQPGVHLRGIKSELGLPMGVLNHHLRKLEEEELIKSKLERQYRRFYPYHYSMRDSPLLSPAQRKVYDTIYQHPGVSPRELGGLLEKSRRTIYNHVNSLDELGMIRTRKEGKKLRCYVMEAA